MSCNPTLFPEFVTLSWIHNGNGISDTVDGTTFSPVDRNHNLIIESPGVNNSGIYHCIAAPAVNLSINVTVVESKRVVINKDFHLVALVIVMCVLVQSLSR